MSYSRYGAGGYGSSSRYSSDLPSFRSTDSRRDSYGTSSYRRDSNSSSRYGPLDYGSTRYSSYSTSKDGVGSGGGRYDLTSRYTDPDRFTKYRGTSVVEKDYAVPAAEEVKEEEAPAVEEEEALDNSEVLQESDVDHFSTEPVVEEPADEVLSYHSEEPVEMYEPEPEPQPEPVYVTETTVRRLSLNSPNENIKPEGAGSPKKLGGGVWPPREEMNFSKGGTLEEGAAPGKKRISDLIARFNSGTVENEGAAKNDHRYKSEYGAGGQRGGKVQQSVFQ